MQALISSAFCLAFNKRAKSAHGWIFGSAGHDESDACDFQLSEGGDNGVSQHHFRIDFGTDSHNNPRIVSLSTNPIRIIEPGEITSLLENQSHEIRATKSEVWPRLTLAQSQCVSGFPSLRRTKSGLKSRMYSASTKSSWTQGLSLLEITKSKDPGERGRYALVSMAPSTSGRDKKGLPAISAQSCKSEKQAPMFCMPQSYSITIHRTLQAKLVVAGRKQRLSITDSMA